MRRPLCGESFKTMEAPNRAMMPSPGQLVTMPPKSLTTWIRIFFDLVHLVVSTPSGPIEKPSMSQNITETIALGKIQRVNDDL
jgi:hypothetical protein